MRSRREPPTSRSRVAARTKRDGCSELPQALRRLFRMLCSSGKPLMSNPMIPSISTRAVNILIGRRPRGSGRSTLGDANRRMRASYHRHLRVQLRRHPQTSDIRACDADFCGWVFGNRGPLKGAGRDRVAGPEVAVHSEVGLLVAGIDPANRGPEGRLGHRAVPAAWRRSLLAPSLNHLVAPSRHPYPKQDKPNDRCPSARAITNRLCSLRVMADQ